MFSEEAVENLIWRMHFSHRALNGEGFLEAADGMENAAVKLEENLSGGQIGSQAKERASP